MKQCFKCKGMKDILEFYPHPRMADGYLNKCKECTKKDAKNRTKKLYSSNLKWIKAERERGREKYQKLYSGIVPTKERKQKAIIANRRWRNKNPQKCAAHRKIAQAIKKGIIVKSIYCENCFVGGNLHAHHEDYSKPLEVVWWCCRCHRKYHRKD